MAKSFFQNLFFNFQMITTFIIDHFRRSDYHFWNALYFIFRSETVRGDQILHPSMMTQNSQIFKVCPSSLFHQNEVGNLRLDMKLFSIWYLCAKIMQSQNEFSSLENGYQKLHFLCLCRLTVRMQLVPKRIRITL